MTPLRVELATDGATATLSCGLVELRDATGVLRWMAFVKDFLLAYCGNHVTSLTLLTLDQYDWYSEFCSSRQIPFQSELLPHGLRIVLRPRGTDHVALLVDALVEDEVWDRDGFLEITLLGSTLRPYADGKWFEWVGPSEGVVAVEAALRYAVQKNPVHLIREGG